MQDRILAEAVDSADRDLRHISIKDAAQRLLDVLNMKHGEAEVSDDDAHSMFYSASSRQGFDAVQSFLITCTEIEGDQ